MVVDGVTYSPMYQWTKKLRHDAKWEPKTVGAFNERCIAYINVRTNFAMKTPEEIDTGFGVLRRSVIEKAAGEGEGRKGGKSIFDVASEIAKGRLDAAN